MRTSYRALFFMAATLAVVVMVDPVSSQSSRQGTMFTALTAPADPLAASLQVADRNTTLQKLTRANITSSLAPGTLDSYKSEACIYAGDGILTGKGTNVCTQGAIGVLMPSSAYLMVSVGKMRIIELINPEGSWRITANLGGTAGAPGQKAILEEGKSSALKEQVAHSLMGLLRLLNTASENDLSHLKLADTPSHVVITWSEGTSSNQFFFNRKGLLCDKHVRTTPVGVTVLKYGEYKSVQGVMLPYRIEMEGVSGKVAAVQVVQTWTLGASWPPTFFTPEGVVGGP
jgi:hypothetical protein